MRSVICAAPHYLKTHGQIESPADLLDHRCLVYSNLADPTKWAYRENDGSQRVIEVHPALQASSGDFLTNAAALGMGIVIQPTTPSCNTRR